MAGSEYYGEIAVGGRGINDATSSEWDQAYENTKLSVDDVTYVGDNKLSFSNTDYYVPTNNNNPSFSLFNNTNEVEVDYKFNEGALIEEFKQYIDSTYGGHYGQGGLQSSEVIIDRGHGMGFFSGNIDKYNGRYGKKGENPADWRKDIMKTIHYGFLKLFEHDRLNSDSKKV